MTEIERLIEYSEIPVEFLRECRCDYDDEPTYIRVTHMPTGINHYQDNSGCKLRLNYRDMGYRVVYSIWKSENG